MGPPDLRRRVDAVARDLAFSAEDRLDALVAGALAGHEAAWNALVDRLQRVVWKAVIALHLIRDMLQPLGQ